MNEVVKICKKHGELSLEQVYRNNDKKLKAGFCYKCKLCVYENASKRPCKIHGELTSEERVPSGKCRYCCLASIDKANRKRNSNREWFNERQRLKREANPELAKLKYKERYDRDVDRHGSEKINEYQKENKRGMKSGSLKLMLEDQDNKCAICNLPETRIFTNRVTKEMRIACLCIDHDHQTGNVRQLLCHDCNTMIGKAKENIQTLQSAIDYLKKHKELPNA
jgi:hypothetical protein